MGAADKRNFRDKVRSDSILINSIVCLVDRRGGGVCLLSD